MSELALGRVRARRRRLWRPSARVVLLALYLAGNLIGLLAATLAGLRGWGVFAAVPGMTYAWFFIFWRRLFLRELARWRSGRPLWPVQWFEWALVALLYLSLLTWL